MRQIPASLDLGDTAADDDVISSNRALVSGRACVPRDGCSRVEVKAPISSVSLSTLIESNGQGEGDAERAAKVERAPCVRFSPNMKQVLGWLSCLLAGSTVAGDFDASSINECMCVWRASRAGQLAPCCCFLIFTVMTNRKASRGFTQCLICMTLQLHTLLIHTMTKHVLSNYTKTLIMLWIHHNILSLLAVPHPRCSVPRTLADMDMEWSCSRCLCDRLVNWGPAPALSHHDNSDMLLLDVMSLPASTVHVLYCKHRVLPFLWLYLCRWKVSVPFFIPLSFGLFPLHNSLTVLEIYFFRIWCDCVSAASHPSANLLTAQM